MITPNPSLLGLNASVGSLADLITDCEFHATERHAYCTSDDCRGEKERVEKLRVKSTAAVCPDCEHVLFWEVVRGKRRKTDRYYAEGSR